MNREVCVRFGSLPIGTVFYRIAREKDPADRRRRILARRRYTKTRHGSIAGFASSGGDEHRLEHSWRVYISADDLRLMVAVARNVAKAASE